MAKNKDRKKARDGKKGNGKAKSARPRMADNADRHVLYQKSVQCVEAEIDFVDETFSTLRGRLATRLREDFCGTGNTSCEWVRRRPANTALGVDLDAEVLAWGDEHNRAALGEAARRMRFARANVLEVECEPMDVVLAMNFSYWILKDRAATRQYFRRVRDTLTDDGIFFLDCYGGYEASQVMKERTKHEGFTYVWEQADYNPITGAMKCNIHFEFPDRSRMKNAFRYEWRLWTLPEVQELLVEAGYRDVTVYWEEWDEEADEGSGIYHPATTAEQDAAWVCYVVAQK
jgi:SAM-dependent methyltransferase